MLIIDDNSPLAGVVDRYLAGKRKAAPEGGGKEATQMEHRHLNSLPIDRVAVAEYQANPEYVVSSTLVKIPSHTFSCNFTPAAVYFAEERYGNIVESVSVYKRSEYLDYAGKRGNGMATAIICDYCGKQYGVKASDINAIIDPDTDTGRDRVHTFVIRGEYKPQKYFTVEVDYRESSPVAKLHFCSANCLKKTAEIWSSNQEP